MYPVTPVETARCQCHWLRCVGWWARNPSASNVNVSGGESTQLGHGETLTFWILFLNPSVLTTLNCSMITNQYSFICRTLSFNILELYLLPNSIFLYVFLMKLFLRMTLNYESILLLLTSFNQTIKSPINYCKNPWKCTSVLIYIN